MSELEEKLNALLSDPNSMAQVMQMAQQLSGAMGEQKAAAPPPPPRASPTASAPPHTSDDPPGGRPRRRPRARRHGRTLDE